MAAVYLEVIMHGLQLLDPDCVANLDSIGNFTRLSSDGCLPFSVHFA